MTPAITKFVWMPKFVLIIFLFLFSYNLKAQTWEFGEKSSAIGYMSDLNTSDPIKPSGPSFGLFAKYNFNGYLAIRANYGFGIIAAADSNSKNLQFRQRNLSFTTTLSEVSLMAEFNFMRYIPSVTNSNWTPYTSLSACGGKLQPDNGLTTAKNARPGPPLETEGHRRSIFHKRIFHSLRGLGFKYNLTGRP